MAPQTFLFVDVDDATGRSNTKKPASQRYSKAARKHVMRDIGLARRKDRTVKGSKLHSVGQEPDSVDGPTAKGPTVELATIRRQEHAPPAYHDELDSHRSSLPPMQGLHETETQPCLPVVARPVGCYRQDPFVKYPVEMSDRGRLLLDTRK